MNENQSKDQQYYQQILEASPSGMIFVDVTGKIQLVNKATEVLFGYSREELLGMNVDALVPQRYRGNHPQHRQGFHKDPKVRSMGAGRDLYGFRKDGSEVPIEIGLSPMETDEGRFVLASIVDITERKKMDELLHSTFIQMEGQKKALDEFAIVVETDPKGKIIYVNDQFCKTSKYSREELIGKDHRDVANSGYHSKEFWHNFWATIHAGKIFRGDVRNKAKDGTFYWEDTTIVPFLGKDGKPEKYLAVRANITERKRAEEKIVEEKKQLEKVNLELDSFVYTASHDLRAPLRAVSSFANFLEEDCKDRLSEIGRDHLLEIRKGVGRMTRIIDDLLTLSKMSRVKNPYENVDMNQLVENAKTRIVSDVKAKNVEFCIRPKLPTVYCDRIKMEEVFVNLLGNAVKFSSKNNHVPKVGLDYRETKDEHEFYVADNGIGIEPRFHTQIFELFKRLHTQEEYEGTGAGLSIVKRIIEDHKGRIWVESELEKGAKFIFTIPKNPKELDHATKGG